MGVAYRRAVHQVLDQPPVFDDPLAKVLLSAEARTRLETDPWQGNRGLFMARLRAFLAVRSRIAEDCVASTVCGLVAADAS